MEFNLVALIGISLAAMFFGYFFGLFEGRGQGYKRRKKEEAAQPPPAMPPVAPTPAAPPAPRDQSLLRLALDKSQRPILEMDGRSVDVSASLGPDQRKRLIDLMLIMRPWVEAGPTPKPSVPAQTSAAANVADRPSSGLLADRLAAVSQAAPAAIAAANAVATPDSAKPVASREAPEPGSPTTMVGQIDGILQMRLTGTPLAGKGIRVIESAEGGAAILVGTQRYPGVSDVPDPEVKAAIKAAIAEWEQRYTPS